jgi:hypothetical protein
MRKQLEEAVSLASDNLGLQCTLEELTMGMDDVLDYLLGRVTKPTLYSDLSGMILVRSGLTAFIVKDIPELFYQQLVNTALSVMNGNEIMQVRNKPGSYVDLINSGYRETRDILKRTVVQTPDAREVAAEFFIDSSVKKLAIRHNMVQMARGTDEEDVANQLYFGQISALPKDSVRAIAGYVGLIASDYLQMQIKVRDIVSALRGYLLQGKTHENFYWDDIKPSVPIFLDMPDGSIKAKLL